MNETELAEQMYAAVQYHTNYSKRSLQAKAFQVGLSDLGFCSERTRRMLKQEVPDDRDMLAAFTGTALGDYIEQAAVEKFPDAIRQATVQVTLHGDSNEYVVTGHPDLILVEDAILLDVKTTRGLENVRRTGPSQQQQFQRHCYALGAWEAGFFGDTPLYQVRVANLWMDRAADDKQFHVQMEPFDPEWVTRAAMWIDDVVYAYLHDEEARKEPPREMCAKVCGFYETCRALDTDVEGLLTEPSVLAAVDMDREGAALVRQGYKLRDEAKSYLTGVEGSTGKWLVRWVHTNASDISYTRQASERLDVKPIPQRKVKG